MGQIRAVTYCRCSTEEESQIDALSRQVQEGRDCIAEMGWIQAGEYVESKSGTTRKGRTEYNRLFDDLQMDLFDVIVIKSQDRLMRNVKDWYVFLDRMISNGKRLYIYIERKFYTPDDALITGIKAILAEEYSRELSKKINNAHRHRQKNGGKVMLTSHTYGYHKNNDGSVSIIESEAAIIREIYELSAAGYGCYSIVNILRNERHLKRSGRAFENSVAVDLAVRLRLALGRAAARDSGQEVVVGAYGVLLGPRLHRHDDVGARLDGGRHEDVHGGDELGLLHGLVPALGLAAHAGDAVGGLDPHALHLAGLHVLQAHVGHGLGEAVAVHGELFPAHALLLHLLVDEVVDAPGAGGGLVHAHGRGGVAHAARHVEVAGDGPQRRDGGGAGRALALHVNGESPHDVGRLGRGEQARGGHDLLLGNPRHGLHLVERQLAGALGQLVEAVGPALHEVVVVEVLVDDDLDHAEREARVGAGAQLQVDVGVRGEPRDARLHADELAAELHGVGHPVAHEEVGVGDGGVAAPDDGALGAHPLGVVVAQRRELREVGDEHAAVGHDHERQAGQVAGGAGQEAVLVGAAERVRHAADLPLVVAGGAAQAVDGVAAVGHGDAAELLVAGFQRLVPRDALPLAASALAHAPHGVQDAVGVELHLLEGQAPGAQRAAVVRVVRVALALDELAGLLVGVHQHAAAHGQSRQRHQHGHMPAPRQRLACTARLLAGQQGSRDQAHDGHRYAGECDEHSYQTYSWHVLSFRGGYATALRL